MLPALERDMRAGAPFSGGPPAHQHGKGSPTVDIFMGLLFDFFNPLSLISFPGLVILGAICCAICCAILCCCATFSFVHRFGPGRRWHDDAYDDA